MNIGIFNSDYITLMKRIYVVVPFRSLRDGWQKFSDEPLPENGGYGMLSLPFVSQDSEIVNHIPNGFKTTGSPEKK